MKGRTYCVAKVPNDASFKNNTHIPGISIHYFPKDVAVWPKCRRPYAPYRLQIRLLRTFINQGKITREFS